MLEVISKVIPILLLIAFGYYIQTKKLADKKSVGLIKKAVINIALPAVLFLTFKDMELRAEYFLVSLTVFVMLFVFYLVGLGLNKIPILSHPILPFLTTSYSFGLLAIPLFGAVYGIENLGTISVFGVAHEIFIWFVYLTILQQKLGGHKFSFATIKNFFKSPLILAILSGLLINITGFNQFFTSNFILVGIEKTLSYIASTATPIVLIIIGYGLMIEKSYMRISVKLMLIRFSVVLIVGYLVKYLVLDRIIGGGNPLFNMAYFTFLIMPPPFSLAIFVGEYSSEENMTIANNTTVLATVTAVLVFVLASLIM